MDNCQVNINVVVNPIFPLSSEEYLVLSRLQVKQLSGSSRLLIDEPPVKPEGGHVFEWTALQLGPIPLKFRQLLLLNQGRAFLVTGVAPLHQFENYRPVIEATLESFRVLSSR